MNSEALEDLKQFITATVSQQLSLHLGDLHEEISGMHGELGELREEIKNSELRLSGQIQKLSDSVAEAMSDSNEEVDKQLKNHETRITNLETKAA